MPRNYPGSKKDKNKFDTTYGKALHPKVACTEEVFELLCAAIGRLGDCSVARRMIGLSNDEYAQWVKKYPERIEAAMIEGDKHRVGTAMKLLEKAASTAMLLDDPVMMLSVARVIAPELVVYPVEAEKARARQDYAAPAVALQISDSMAGLGQRLQDSLKAQALSAPENVIPSIREISED